MTTWNDWTHDNVVDAFRKDPERTLRQASDELAVLEGSDPDNWRKSSLVIAVAAAKGGVPSDTASKFVEAVRARFGDKFDVLWTSDAVSWLCDGMTAITDEQLVAAAENWSQVEGIAARWLQRREGLTGLDAYRKSSRLLQRVRSGEDWPKLPLQERVKKLRECGLLWST